MKTLHYIVGEHALSISFADDTNDERLIPSFSRFRVDALSQAPLFCVLVDDAFRWETLGREIGQFDSAGNNYGVYKTAEGGYQFTISDPDGVLCSHVQTNTDFGEITVALKGETWQQRNFGLNNAIMLAYAFAGADKGTLLMHASVIRCDGKGYLMTAPSGTGKSTHTRLWYDNIPGCDLMNDDNPVVRIVDGEAYVYGSPWSGKTPCYRQVKAHLGAIVRIDRAKQNSIERLNSIEAFASLLPACSTMKWDGDIFNAICDNVTSILERVGIYTLHCLPDKEAARVCHKEVTK